MPPCVLIRRNSRAHAQWVQMSVRRYKHGHGDNIGNTRAHRELPSPDWTGGPGPCRGNLVTCHWAGATTTTTRCAECVARASEAERGHRAETTTATTTTTRCEVRCQPLKMRARPTGIGTVDPGLQWISAPGEKQQLSFIPISLVDILGTGAWRGLSRVPVSGSFSGADMISGIKDRLRWRYYIVARATYFCTESRKIEEKDFFKRQ